MNQPNNDSWNAEQPLVLSIVEAFLLSHIEA